MPEPRKPMGVLRIIFAAIGIIIMVLSGGCALLMSGLAGGSDFGIALAFSVPPFLVGLLIWWLAVNAGRQ